jgi:hypothetical protein
VGTLRRRAVAALMLALVAAAACTLAPLPTPIPTPSPTPSPIPATPTPVLSPSPTPRPTPDPGSIPSFSAGDVVTTLISGLRVRGVPGTEGRVVAGLLPLDAELVVVMGPIPVDGFGWYLVQDGDPAEPTFEEGWLAAGYEPDPFVAPTGRRAQETSLIASFAGIGNGQYGPVRIADEHIRIRWLIRDPESIGCNFAVSLAAGEAEPIPAIRATVGGTIIPGTLPSTYFADEKSLRGQVFATVESTCAWTFVVERLPAEPTPTP